MTNITPTQPEVSAREYRLIGYIAGAHANGNSHFMNEDGVVLCGSKSRLGFDASIEIRFREVEDFDHDQASYKDFYGNKVWHSNHLPLRCYITCMKCQAKLSALLTSQELTFKKIEG